MNLFFGSLQIIGWIGVGYYLNSNNWWAVTASILFAFFSGLASAMNMVGKQLGNNGHTNK
jgi:hypothetical protein